MERADRSDSLPQTTGLGLPRSLAPCFQEYDVERIDPDAHWELVAERTLAYGNLDELRWLFARYGRARLRDWVRRMGARRLPWRRYQLWCALLDLPPARRLRPPDQQIWPY